MISRARTEAVVVPSPAESFVLPATCVAGPLCIGQLTVASEAAAAAAAWDLTLHELRNIGTRTLSICLKAPLLIRCTLIDVRGADSSIGATIMIPLA